MKKKLKSITITLSKEIDVELATDTVDSLQEGECLTDLFIKLDNFFSDVSKGKISVENIMNKCKEFHNELFLWEVTKEEIEPLYSEDEEPERDEDDFMEDFED